MAKNKDLSSFIELLDKLNLNEGLENPAPLTRPRKKRASAKDKKAAAEALRVAREALKQQAEKRNWEKNPDPSDLEPLAIQKIRTRAEPQFGDAPGGYCITDRYHNIVDIWDNLTEKEACEKFNNLKFPPKLRRQQLWLLAINQKGQSMGVLGVNWH